MSSHDEENLSKHWEWIRAGNESYPTRVKLDERFAWLFGAPLPPYRDRGAFAPRGLWVPARNDLAALVVSREIPLLGRPPPLVAIFDALARYADLKYPDRTPVTLLYD